MKIFEVMLAREAAPGSFAAKAGVFGKALAGALTKQAFGVDPSQYQDSAGAEPQIDAFAAKVGGQLAQAWKNTVSQVMAATKTPGGGTGVTDFQQIDQTLLTQQMGIDINNAIKSISGGRYPSLNDLSRSPDLQKLPISQQQQARKALTDINGIRSNRALLKLDPNNPSDMKKIDELWIMLAQSVSVLTRIAETPNTGTPQGTTAARGAATGTTPQNRPATRVQVNPRTGAVTVGNQAYNPQNATHRQIMQNLVASATTPSGTARTATTPSGTARTATTPSGTTGTATSPGGIIIPPGSRTAS